LPRSFYRVVTFSLSQVNSKRAGYIFFFTQFNLLREGARRRGGGGALFGLYTHTHARTERKSERARGKIQKSFIFYTFSGWISFDLYPYSLFIYLILFISMGTETQAARSKIYRAI